MYSYFENSLFHHGIEGQKWGVRNGPPYPLDEKRMSKAEKIEARKDRAIAEGDAEYISDHLNQFTDEELKAIYPRLDTAKKIRDIHYGDTRNKISNYTSTTGAVNSTLTPLKTAAETVKNILANINLYNVIKKTKQ